MGLRRRLSKKWNETVNGVLSGPGVDVDSVNTDDLGIKNLPLGSVKEYLNTDQDTDARRRGGLAIQYTDNVSTSAKVVYEIGSTNNAEFGAFVVVSGYSNDTASDKSFTDLVLVQTFGGATRVDTQGRNSPDEPNYSLDDNEDLELAMSANTYDIAAHAIELVNSANR